ncbi:MULTISPECIES: hypothetical protein [Photobacterium]|nr:MULTISPECIES: hypothetical protein [Photobacterium]MBV1842146.1 hypothetical protein [Photobacterium ganghwense]QSV15044.1 hypothetical protein FH974_05465 [Photobacterium ganghwense]
MLSQAINTIGMCIMGGKYLLIVILAATMLLSGNVQAEMLAFSHLDPTE